MLSTCYDRAHDVFAAFSKSGFAGNDVDSCNGPASGGLRLTAIADSSAFKDPERMLTQHQAALTLLQSHLSTPGTLHVSWLDLACGRGQIILSLDRNFSLEARAKVNYWAYDIEQGFVRETVKTAKRLGLASVQSAIGELADFDRILPPNLAFDFITITNTVHEIEPARLAGLLVTSVARLTDTGTLFMYDMDRITPAELGAVPWSRDDIRRIAHRMLDCLGASSYRPEVGLWNHKTCNGWNIQIHRQHLCVSRADAAPLLSAAVRETRNEIAQLLGGRLSECRDALETLTLCGAETAAEQDERQTLLFEFWALSRAMEHCL